MDEPKKYTLEELKAKLTEKERIFCHNYIIDWNGARSAREAGYSEESAKQIAHENLTKLYLNQYIDFIKNDIEKEAGISKLRMLNELTKLAFSNIAHLHNTWITLKEFESLTDDQKACIETIDTKTQTINFDDETKTVEYVKIKLYSKLQAIDSINKMIGYNSPDKVDVALSGRQIMIINGKEIVF
jgi:phage terminase small subunit